MKLEVEKKKIILRLEDRDMPQVIEERIHPLTKQKVIFNVARSTRPHDDSKLSKEEKKLIEEIVKKTREHCVFCKDGIKNTPVMPDGHRIIRNEFKLFPNLYPFGERHYIGVLCDSHFLYLNEFQEKHFYDALTTIKKLSQRDKAENKYLYISFNYLPPAGASLIHPHLQILIRDKRTNNHEILCKRSNGYYRVNKISFWDEYRKVAEKNNLLLEESHNFYIAASFAPTGDKQLEIIHKSKSAFYDLHDKEIQELSSLIIKVLRFYHYIGVNSLNFTSFSNKKGQAEEFFRFHMVFVARPNLKEYYSSDKAFMEVLHNHPIILTLPESLKEKWDEFNNK